MHLCDNQLLIMSQASNWGHPLKIVSRSLASIMCLLLLGSTPAISIEPERPGQEAFFTHAVFAEGRLWILSDSGTLSSISETDKDKTQEIFGAPVLDVCLHLGHLTALLGGQPRGDSQVSLVEHSQGVWSSPLVSTHVEGQPLAMDCSRATISLLTSMQIIELDTREPHVAALPIALKPFGVTATLATSDAFYIGFNKGEWGGGMSRVDRRSGIVTTIEKTENGQTVLDPAVDPVNSIIPAQADQDCVLAAIGLIHFLPHGRIVEVCRSTAREIYSRPYTHSSHWWSPRKSYGPEVTEALFGLVLVNQSVWAVSDQGLYKLTSSGKAEEFPLPKFKRIGGIDVNFDIPGLVLVLTDVNQRHSVSGAVPLLVAR